MNEIQNQDLFYYIADLAGKLADTLIERQRGDRERSEVREFAIRIAERDLANNESVMNVEKLAEWSARTAVEFFSLLDAELAKSRSTTKSAT